MRRSVLLLSLVACGQVEEPRDYSAYHPFDEANLASQWARLAAHEAISELGDEVDAASAGEVFAAIGDAYESDDLAVKVAGREDDRVAEEGYGQPAVGAFLDAQIRDAIARGAEAATDRDAVRAAETVSKALLVFFGFSVYHELHERERATLDEAFGYYGLEFDGSPRAGLGVVAAGRESEFGVTLNGPVLRAFVDARHALEAEDAAAYDEAFAVVDDAVRRTLLYYALHEVDGIEPQNADIKLLEARIVWDGVEAWALHADPVVAEAAIDALYPTGRDERSAAGFWLAGLDAITAGEVVVEPTDVRAALGDVLAVMESR